MSQDCVGSPGPSKMKSALWELSSSWEVGHQMLINKEALGLDCQAIQLAAVSLWQVT